MIDFLLPTKDDEKKEFLVEIYTRYLPFIKKRLTYAVPKVDVEDCIQECFVRLAKNVQQLQKLYPSQVTIYVQQTIRSVIVDYTKKKKLLIIEYDIDMVPDGKTQQSSVEKEIEYKEAYERFFKGFHKLPQVDQIILRGLYQDDMSREDLVKQLGIKSSSIRTYISRAKKHALQLMRGEFDEK